MANIIDEGASLLRSSGLEQIQRQTNEQPVIFHYLCMLQQKPGAPSLSLEYLEKWESLFADGGQTKVKPEHFKKPATSVDHAVPLRPQSIRVIDLVGCDIVKAKKFADAAVETAGTSPSAVFDFSRLEYRKDSTYSPISGGFVTGVSLRAAAGPTKFLTLFVSIPYLGVGDKTSPSGSRTLRQYRLRAPLEPRVRPGGATTPGGTATTGGTTTPGGTATPGGATTPGGTATAGGTATPGGTTPPQNQVQILVHQTWFLVFDNERIAIFRSKDDKYRNLAPLFSHQQRVGAFQALVHMVSNLITLSEQEALENFREKITKWELSQESDTPESTIQLGSHQTDLYTIIQIVHSQTKYLEDLRQIFQTSYNTDFNNRPQWNEREIAFMDGHPEQIRSASNSITAILADRKKLLKELRELVKELKLLRLLFVHVDQAKNQGNQTEVQADMKKSLEQQGQTISVFTLITSIFLPLGFLSSFFAMSPPGYQNTIHTVGQFWMFAAPITFVVVGAMSFFLFYKDSSFKKWLKKMVLAINPPSPGANAVIRAGIQAIASGSVPAMASAVVPPPYRPWPSHNNPTSPV